MNFNDAKSFVSLLLLIGYFRLPRRAMYWKCSDDTQKVLVRNTMSRNEFGRIMQNLHLEDNDRLDVNDKFAKVRELINLMNTICINYYLPEQFVIIG